MECLTIFVNSKFNPKSAYVNYEHTAYLPYILMFYHRLDYTPATSLIQ